MKYSLDKIIPRLTVPEAVHELRAGHFLLIIDRQQKTVAALCLAAQLATPERIQQMLHSTRNDMYAFMSSARRDALHILPEQTRPELFYKPAAEKERTTEHNQFHVSRLLRTLVNPATRPGDVPAHPALSLLTALPGGVLQSRGYAEGIFDLLRIAGMEPVAAIGKVTLNDQIDDAQEELLKLVRDEQVGMLSLDTLINYRREHQVSFVTETRLPTPWATFRLLHFQEIETGQPYLALLLGDLDDCQRHPPLLRLHSACATGDIFGSQRCDCQAQLHSALHTIAAEGRGALLYLPQEGRGIGLAGKLQAYALQEQGYDTLEANERLGYPGDARDYSSAIEALRELSITHARLLTNNPRKLTALEEAGIAVEVVPLETAPTSSNLYYLQTKQRRMGHLFASLTNNLADETDDSA